MPIETAVYVSDFDQSNPPGSDDVSQGDNHIRMMKAALKTTFPNATKAFRFPTSGAVKTANFSVTFPDDQNVLFAVDTTSGVITASLPDPTAGGTVNEDGFGFWILRSAGTNNVTVTPSGVQTIMGASSYSMAANRQWAYFFWAGTTNTWYVFEGNNPAITFGLQIVTASETALIVRRTENVLDTEYTIASWRLGSGAGNVAADTLVSGGANDVKERRRYIGATEFERVSLTLIKHFLNTQIGDNILWATAGYGDLTEIAAPAVPAANVARLYAVDVSTRTRLAYVDSAGNVSILTQEEVPARGYSENTATTSLTDAIPDDGSTPQITEGTQINTVTVTMKRASSRLRIRAVAGSVQQTTNDNVTMALFRVGSSDALNSAMFNPDTVSTPQPMAVEVEIEPGSVGPHEITCRIGSHDGSGVVVNYPSGSGRKATLVVEEIFV